MLKVATSRFYFGRLGVLIDEGGRPLKESVCVKGQAGSRAEGRGGRGPLGELRAARLS